MPVKDNVVVSLGLGLTARPGANRVVMWKVPGTNRWIPPKLLDLIEPLGHVVTPLHPSARLWRIDTAVAQRSSNGI